ncbi:MAG: GGDEF domain-containing protein, partial [Gammaproteobacteria bacterium]
AALTDPLTGLGNRAAFQAQMRRMVDGEPAGAPPSPFMLLLVDVDHFKNYNDTHGHAAGDRALFSLARVLTEHVRPDAVVARYGGEEFLVVLPETDLEQGRRIAQRLVDEVNKMRFTLPDNVTSSGITVSIGLAQANPDGAAGDVYAAADAALRRAREKGRSCVAT